MLFWYVQKVSSLWYVDSILQTPEYMNRKMLSVLKKSLLLECALLFF
jgi:hypothetical protein